MLIRLLYSRPKVRTIVIRQSIHQISVSGVIYMMQQLVVGAHGLIALQWRVTIKTSAPNKIHVTLAGKYRIITKETNSFFMLIEENLSNNWKLICERTTNMSSFLRILFRESQGTDNVHQRAYQ